RTSRPAQSSPSHRLHRSENQSGDQSAARPQPLSPPRRRPHQAQRPRHPRAQRSHQRLAHQSVTQVGPGRATISGMQTDLNPIELPQPIHERLTADDDGALWATVLDAAADDAMTALQRGRSEPLYAVVGLCSHWIRPHQSRWTADGGFALPLGYGDGSGLLLGGLPQFDWSVNLCFNFERRLWGTPDEPPTKGHHSVRL